MSYIHRTWRERVAARPYHPPHAALAIMLGMHGGAWSLIAVDEASSLMGTLFAFSALAAGIVGFIWVCVQIDRLQDELRLYKTSYYLYTGERQ